MAIIIKKRLMPKPQEPDALVARAPAPAPEPYVELDKRKVATTLDEFLSNRATTKPPEPRECSLCGHEYAYPCDGKNSKCMNAEYARQHGAVNA